jgi:hypothetical protein
MPDSMQHDVFVSYCGQDEGWAVRLEKALKTEGLLVFRDQERLTAGDNWNESLSAALVASRNLVVLGSPAALASRWVGLDRFRWAAP